MEYLPSRNPNNIVFNVANFDYQDSYLTYYLADNRYVRKSSANVYYGLNTFNGATIFNNTVNVNSDLSVSQSIAALDGTINNSFSIGSNLAISGNIVCQNVISAGNLTIQNVQCKTITCDAIIAGNQTGVYLYCNSLTLPILKSIPDTTIMYTNLNLSSLMGTTGASSTILLYPNYGIQIMNSSTVLFSFFNSATDLLYHTITFSSSNVCTSIQIYHNLLLV